MKKKLYEIIKEYIIELIENHRNEKDYLLPSESQLAITLRASRGSVRKALSELEQENYIYTIKGKGSYIKLKAGQSSNRFFNLASQANESNDIFAVILPETATHFVNEICRGIYNFCLNKNRKFIIMQSYGNSKTEEQNLSIAQKLGCKGIIIMPTDEYHYNTQLLNLAISKLPTITVDRKLTGLNMPCVSSNHFNIGYQATKYLLDLGHKQIAFITHSNMITSVNERLSGYESALNNLAASLDYHKLIISDINEDANNMTILHYLRDHPEITGIIVNSGPRFCITVNAMNQLGKKLHEAYEIVALDNDAYSEITYLLQTTIPSVIQDGYQIGYTAANLLYEIIYNNSTSKEDIFVPLKKLP